MLTTKDGDSRNQEYEWLLPEHASVWGTPEVPSPLEG